MKADAIAIGFDLTLRDIQVQVNKNSILGFWIKDSAVVNDFIPFQGVKHYITKRGVKKK